MPAKVSTVSPASEEGRDYGRLCVFCSRSCGVFSSIVVLLCGFLNLIPFSSLPAPAQSYSRCLAVALLMILSAVVIFFLEATVLGHCFERVSFLLVINKYIKNWMRAALYICMAFIPIVLWCISISSIIGLGTMFMIGAVNFVLTIGAKGDHNTTDKSGYSRVTLSGLHEEDEEAANSAESDHT